MYALPERYRQGADEVLENDAYTLSEISFLIQDRSLSAVFKMEWTERIHTNDDIESYRDNLSKLLAMKVILQLCKGDIHGARFAQMCTRRNIDAYLGV